LYNKKALILFYLGKETWKQQHQKKALEPKDCKEQQALKKKSVGKHTKNKSLETKSQKAPLRLFNR